MLLPKHWFMSAAYNAGFGSAVEAGEFLANLMEQQKYRCPYSGIELVLGVNAWLDHKMPVSRFPELRGDRSNVEWLDERVNKVKNAMTPEEFIRFCKLVASNRCHIVR
jgi:hypothetical protein